MAEIVHVANEALKRAARKTADEFGVPNCIVLTEDGTGGVRMAVVGAGSEKIREILCAAIADTYM
jgi:hypothetical protein